MTSWCRIRGEQGGVACGLVLATVLVGIAGCGAPRAAQPVRLTSGEASRASMRIVGDPDNDNERAVAGSAAESGSSLADGVLTLEAARQAALSGNPSVHEARARLQAARARVSEARARLFPKLTFAHKSTRTFQTPPSRPQLTSALQAFQQSPTTLNADVLRDIPAVFLPIFQPLFNTGSLQSNSNAFGNHSTGLTATWTVFDGFIREAQILASEHLKHAAGYALGNVRRLVVHAVDTAYYQVQLAVEQVRIATADEAFSREQLEETQKLRDAGRASQADVDNFRIRLLAAQANTTAAEGLFDTGRVVLAELMGLPDAALPGDLSLSPLTAETAEETTVPNAASWIEKAMRDRPDLRQLEQIVESEGQRVRAAKGLYSPAVGVSGTWGFDRDSTLHYSSSDQTSLAGVEVRWDLYTGGSRTARVRAAEATRAEAAAALARGRLAVQSEVRQAVIALHDAQEQIGLQREALTTARENRRLIQAAYVGGTQSLTRLNEAQRDYIQADVNLALARIRLRQAWSDLHAAAGGTTTVP